MNFCLIHCVGASGHGRVKMGSMQNPETEIDTTNKMGGMTSTNKSMPQDCGMKDGRKILKADPAIRENESCEDEAGRNHHVID